MKKLSRFLITFVILVPFTFLLSGCHGSKGLPEFVMPEEFDTSRDYEITFWSKNDTNKTQADIYKKAISDFEALYPNIHVSNKTYTNYGLIYNDVITNISTNTTPNVCISYPDNIATYKTGINIVLPLDEIMEDSSYGLGGSKVAFDSPSKDEIAPKFLEECYFDGHYYSLPFMRSTEACYINKDLVEALGYEVPDILTWDFVWEVSEKAMEKNPDGTFKVNGQNVMIPFIYKSTDNMMISYLKQMSAGYSQPDGTIEIFNDTTTDFLLEIASHAKTGAFSTFKISSYPGNFLNAGQCIFAVDSTAGATWMGADAPLSDIAEEDKLNFETVVRMLPQVNPDEPKMISQGPSVCVFNKEDPQEVLASWLFTQFLLCNEVQIPYSETEGYVPVTTKAFNDPSYTEYLNASGTDNKEHYAVKIDAAKMLLDNTENSFVTPVFNGSASLRDAAGALIEDVTKAERRSQPVTKESIDKIYKNNISLYRLDQIKTGSNEKQDLGSLPSASVVLLISLGVVWIILIAIFIRGKMTQMQKKH